MSETAMVPGFPVTVFDYLYSNPFQTRILLLAIAKRSQQGVHYLGGAFVGHIARPLRQHFVYFYARVRIVYDYS